MNEEAWERREVGKHKKEEEEEEQKESECLKDNLS